MKPDELLTIISETSEKMNVMDPDDQGKMLAAFLRFAGELKPLHDKYCKGEGKPFIFYVDGLGGKNDGRRD